MRRKSLFDSNAIDLRLYHILSQDTIYFLAFWKKSADFFDFLIFVPYQKYAVFIYDYPLFKIVSKAFNPLQINSFKAFCTNLSACSFLKKRIIFLVFAFSWHIRFFFFSIMFFLFVIT